MEPIVTSAVSEEFYFLYNNTSFEQKNTNNNKINYKIF